MRFHFSKNHKKYKKIKKKYFFLSKNYPLVHKLSYMFSKKKHFFIFPPPKMVFPFFSQISKNPPDSGDGDVDGDGEKFFIGKCYENLVVIDHWSTPNIYRRP